MKNIPCIPFTEKQLEILPMGGMTVGKGIIFLFLIMPAWMMLIRLWHNNMSLKWWWIMIFCCVAYLYTPNHWYRKTIYHFLIPSFIACIVYIFLYLYTIALLFKAVNLPGKEIYCFIIYAIVFILELFYNRANIAEYQTITKQSILRDKERTIFSLYSFIKKSQRKLSSKSNISENILIITMIPYILFGHAFGHPTITAKHLSDDALLWVMLFGVMLFFMFFLKGIVFEFIKFYAIMTYKL